MAYNEKIETRIKKIVSGWKNTEDKKMFGGIGYLINGSMCFGINKESLVLRTSPEKAEKLMRSEYITPFDITGKPRKGWVLVSPDVLETDDQLLDMLRFGVSFTDTSSKK